MNWSEIMEMKDPNEALLKIAETVEREDLPIEEMEKAMFRYAKKHKILVDQMAYYPNGDNVMATYKHIKK